MKNNRVIPNWINGEIHIPKSNQTLEKFNPHTGLLDSLVVSSDKNDVSFAVEVALKSFQIWSNITPVERGNMLMKLVDIFNSNRKMLGDTVSRETGKSNKDALGEVNAAILQGHFFSGEGMRLYGKSLTSGVPGKYSHTVRQPIGVAGLIVPSNTPIANIAWKIFPALICGNSVVLKASEDSPEIAFLIGKMTKEAGIPDGVVNIIQGKGDPAGIAIVENPNISLISFTGSTSVGKWIAGVASTRLARVSLELGGKNPFVVCDDADIDLAAHWAVLSAFSNAGQRCAAGSRILIFNNVYSLFVEKFLEKAKKLTLGVNDVNDLGPLINKKQQENILNVIKNAEKLGGKILLGGNTPTESTLSNGYYINPTVIEGLCEDSEIAKIEIFGPVVSLHPVNDITDALRVANSTVYGLSAAIHTKNVDRAMWFAQRVKAGVININIGTYGSEQHMPFGGFGQSGNGTREPGVEALDVYSELKNISFLVRENLI